MKLLVAEDEPLIRESLVRKLRQLGHEDILQASDGTEALALSRAHRPDIALVDIQMPRMDGITFIAEIRNECPDLVVIIISGYSAFEYAQKAIALHVFAYLLKPVNEEQLQDVLRTASASVAHLQSLREDSAKSDRQKSKYIDIGRRNLIADLVHNRVAFEHLSETFSELGIRFHEGLFMVILASIDQYGTMERSMTQNEVAMNRFAIGDVFQQMLARESILAWPFSAEHGQGFLLSLPWTGWSECDSLRGLFTEFRETFMNTYSFTITIGVGHPVESLSQAHASYESACRALMQRVQHGGNQVYHDWGKDNSRKGTFNIGHEVEQMLIVCFKTDKRDGVLEIIRNLYQRALEEGVDKSGQLMKLNFQMIYLLYKCMDQSGIHLDRIYGSEITLYHQLNARDSLKGILAFYEELVGTCFAKLREQQISWTGSLMGKAMAYILQNYQSNISESMVAEHINISPSYFSKLFKEENKDSFIDFLTQYRLRKAMEYLDTGKHTVAEVARLVGFNDEKYFHRVFKKSVGITPGKYRKT